MQTFSIVCSSNSLSPSLYFSGSQPSSPLPGKQINLWPNFSFSSKLSSTSLHIRPLPRFLTHSTATEELVATTSTDSAFIETGYICGVHGLQGEVRVKTSTDFPDLRFSEPGTRWLKQQLSGTETIQEIELVEGRGSPGQSWIVRFNDIDTVEQARKLVGSSILVKDEDRPLLEEGEFYTNDLIGMKVILEESGEPIGTVVNVFNSGASDLLHVKLNSLRKIADKNGNSKTEAGDSGPLVWVPFVEAIVPTVDLEKGEMLITPPKGLLELNIRTDEKSKKERRELEWKERKKFQRRLIAAKKKLCEMDQQHVFDGFRYGEKDQRSLLANQIVAVDSKLLQQALQSIETPIARPNLLQILSAVPRSNTLKVSDSPSSSGSGVPSDSLCKLQSKGCLLTSKGKVAIVLVLKDIEEIGKTSDTNLDDSEGKENAHLLVKTLLDDHLSFIEIEHRSSVPLLLVSSTGAVSFLQELFLDHDYFAFDPQKVWFLEEEKLPVVSSSTVENGKHKILMESPWEFLQKPIGSGGVISLLSSQDTLFDKLSELGVEYIEVCNTNQRLDNSHALIGLADSRKSNVGLHLVDDTASEEKFGLLFSMRFFKKLAKQMSELQFEAVLGCNSYVEKVEKDWVDVIPTAPNSYEFQSSIYCCLDAVPANKICVLDPRD